MSDQDLYRTYRLTPRDSHGRGAAPRLFADAYLLPHLASRRGDEILELGSGEGDMLAALRQRGFAHIRGADISPSQVAAARENGVDVTLSDGRAALEATAPNSLAAVIALDVLEHLPLEETLGWLGLAWTCLRPGGLFLVRVPNGEGLFGGSIRYGDITHRTAFTRTSVEQLFFSQGFETIEVRPCRPMVHGPASAVRAVVWRLTESLLWVASGAESGQFSKSCFTRNLFAVGRKSVAVPKAAPPLVSRP